MSSAGELIRRWWRAFTGWRRDRPFWGGVFTIAGALELFALSAAPLQVALIRGIAGIGTLVIAAMLISLAIISWTQVHLRVICGVFIVILGLASFAVSNLGGFFIGLLLTLVGGSLVYAWAPGSPTGATAPADEDAVTESTDLEPATDDDSTDADRAEAVETAAGDGVRLRPAVPVVPVRCAPYRPRLIWTMVCVSIVVAGGVVSVPQASAQSVPVRAEPTWTWPWPWPSPTGEPSSPDDTDEPGEPGDGDPEQPEPGEPGHGCDREKLPDEAPKLGTKEAAKAAKAVAACLAEHDPARAEDRDLPTASTIHPVLNTEVMTMNGLQYGGVVNVPTANGGQRALEFTMDTLDLADMDQSSGIDGTDARLHVMNMGSSAVLNGDVRLYVQRIEGLIFGVVPIVLTADTPPPLIVPYLVITDATVTTAYTRADRVDIPDLREPTR